MFKTLIKELKRHNDIKEKELDLRILGPWEYEKKWGVYPVQPITTSTVVVAPACEHSATSGPAGGLPVGGWR